MHVPAEAGRRREEVELPNTFFFPEPALFPQRCKCKKKGEEAQSETENLSAPPYHCPLPKFYRQEVTQCLSVPACFVAQEGQGRKLQAAWLLLLLSWNAGQVQTKLLNHANATSQVRGRRRREEGEEGGGWGEGRVREGCWEGTGMGTGHCHCGLR